MKSKKHMLRKKSKGSWLVCYYTSAVTLTSMARSRDLREEFVIDFLKMATIADIPLEEGGEDEAFPLEVFKAGWYSAYGCNSALHLHSLFV